MWTMRSGVCGPRLSGLRGRLAYDLYRRRLLATDRAPFVNTGMTLYDNPDKDWTLFIRIPNTYITEGYRIIAACLVPDSGDPGKGLHIMREYTDKNETRVMVGNMTAVYAPESALVSSVIAVMKTRSHYRVFRDGALVTDVADSPVTTKTKVPMRTRCERQCDRGVAVQRLYGQ